MTEKRVKGCLKYGCFGCLGLGTTGVLVIIILAAIGLSQDQAADWKRESLEQAVPVAAVKETDPSQLTHDELQPTFDPADFGAQTPGRVILNFKIGRFEVRPGRPGEPIRVEARYDVNRFKLEQTYDDKSKDGWVYRLDFGQKSIFSLFGNVGEPEVRVYLPPNTPFSLEGDIGMGESDLELGGLWITDADLDVGMGDHSVSFDDPQPVPMNEFKLYCSMGAVRVSRLGNASPASVGVRHRMGEMRLDLRGQWTQDADVKARCSMGECRVTVPRDVAIDVQNARISLGEKTVSGLRNRRPPEPGAPTLRLSVSASMGELRIDG